MTLTDTLALLLRWKELVAAGLIVLGMIGVKLIWPPDELRAETQHRISADSAETQHRISADDSLKVRAVRTDQALTILLRLQCQDVPLTTQQRIGAAAICREALNGTP